jgi:cold shock CspA family protein
LRSHPTQTARNPPTSKGLTLNRASEPKSAKLHGTVAVSALADGYGFIEPDDGSGQLLVRSASIDSDFQLGVGEAVEYLLANGSFAIEAVDVRVLPISS